MAGGGNEGNRGRRTRGGVGVCWKWSRKEKSGESEGRSEVEDRRRGSWRGARGAGNGERNVEGMHGDGDGGGGDGGAAVWRRRPEAVAAA